MKITLAQLNPIVGDINGNLKKIEDTLSSMGKGQTDLIVFSELFLVGYPPRDLLERNWLHEKVTAALRELCNLSLSYKGTGIIIGVPIKTNTGGLGICNSACLIYEGEIIFTQHKTLLPTYDVFDEARYFDNSKEIKVIKFKNETLGLSICEDAWAKPDLWKKRLPYQIDPISVLAEKGATILINISASPFYSGKESERFNLIQDHASKTKLPFIYVNQVGCNDELIFDGRSMCFNKQGELTARLPAFQEALYTIETDAINPSISFNPEEPIKTIYDALVLGIKDYFKKCGFKQAILGLSGGIDSAVTCAIAQAALGKENVIGITMPSMYSSEGSMQDSYQLAENLGIECKTIPINSIYQAYLNSLACHFSQAKPDITEENIQARIRGNILMSFSNKFGHIVLTTGNKSEVAVGYCTLYGDMSGGISVISDVPKTMVYKLAHYINRDKEIIPMNTIQKAPSAELRPDQKDQDSLPPYDILDGILYFYIEEAYSVEQIIEQGYDKENVLWVIKTVNRNEYKRRQAAPGFKVTTKAFGMGRRIPIAAKFEL